MNLRNIYFFICFQIGLAFSSNIYGQKIYISFKPFFCEGIEVRESEDIIYLMEKQLRKTRMFFIVPAQHEIEILMQDDYLLDGSIQIRPIDLSNTHGIFKIVRGRIERATTDFSLSVQLVDTDTGEINMSVMFEGTIDNIKTKGVNNVVNAIAKAVSRLRY